MQVLPNNVGVIIFEKSFSKYKNANCILNLFEANHLKECRVISRQEDSVTIVTQNIGKRNFVQRTQDLHDDDPNGQNCSAVNKILPSVICLLHDSIIRRAT